MATLQIMSDLHLEFMTEFERGLFFGLLDPENVDVLILAGDICSSPMLESTLKRFCDVYPQVIYVHGNHEFYGTSPTEVTGKMWDIQISLKNLTWLDNDMAEVAGLKFLGGTLWFPQPNQGLLHVGRGSINDFNHIREFEPWVYQENAECVAMLTALAPKADVVVTHHLPSEQVISPRFKNGSTASLNHFFCHDFTEEIKKWKPKLWVFGHTHDRVNTRIEDTLLVCNAKGYPMERESSERGKYREKFLVKVDKERAEVVNAV